MATGKKIVTTSCPACNASYRVYEDLVGKKVSCKKCSGSFKIVTAPHADSAPPSAEKEAEKHYPVIVDRNLLMETLCTSSTRKQGALPATLKDFLLENGLMSESDFQYLVSAKKIWETRQLDITFGTIAVKNKFVTREIVDTALVEQKKLFREKKQSLLLGEILISLGSLTEQQRDLILIKQKRLKAKHPCAASPKTGTEREAVQPEAPAAAVEPSPPLEKTGTEKEAVQPEAPAAAVEPSPPLEKTGTEKEAVQPEAPAAAVEPSPPLEKTGTEREAVQPDAPAAGIEPSPHAEKNEAEPAQPEARVPEQPPLTAGPADSPEDAVPPAPDEPAPGEPSETAGETDAVDEPGAPPVEEPAEDGLRIVVSEDRMTAQLKGTKGMEETVTLEAVKSLIEKMEITDGIVDDSLINAFINSEIFREKPFVVAKGNPGNPGRDSEVRYFFDVDHLKAGADRSDGAIDFRDRGKVPHVKEGALLAEKTPGIMAQTGIDIYGHAVVFPEAKDHPFESGPNTELSEDRLKIFAKTDGQPMVSFGGRVSVASELVIPGDVNYETGHIDFEGNIVVRGTIQEGFHVKGANLKAKEASGAEIDVTGDVTIVNGLNSSSVKAGGNVKALFISKSSIESFGDLQVTKEILESTVNISGACVATKGKIISSTIKAKLGIESRDIGTERSPPCRLSVGVDEHVAQKIRELSETISEKNQAIEKNNEEIGKLAAEDQEIQAGIARFAHTQDRSQLEIKSLNESLAEFEKEGNKDKVAETEKLMVELQEKAKNAEEELNSLFDTQDANTEKVEALKAAIAGLTNEIKPLSAEKEAIVSWEKKLKGNSSVVALGRIFPGTVISGTHSRRIIKDALNNARIREVLVGTADSADEWELRVIR